MDGELARGRGRTRRDPPAIGWERRSRLLHPEKVTSVAFAPDGRRLVTGGKRGSATIWSVDGEKLVELDGHSAEITDVAFSADGSRLATASRDETARVWDAGSGRQLLELAPHRDDVTSVAFSPDGRLVLTASRDHDARLWDAETGALAQVLHWHFGEVADATFSPDGRWIVTAGPVTVGLWQPGVQEPILPYGFGGHKPRDHECGLRSQRPLRAYSRRPTARCGGLSASCAAASTDMLALARRATRRESP